jgi:protocatechuate 3,4-dioxygenase beta subunit
MKDESVGGLSRRQFIKRAGVVAIALPALPLGFAALMKSEATTRAVAQSWAGAMDGPLNPSWQIKMVGADEPGEPLLISGTVFEPGGATPAKGITLYVYHTDARGLYSNEVARGGQQFKPRLRGWMRTGNDGKYEFRTIKPASYPNTQLPAHIHVSVSGPGYPEYWIDTYWFEGDPFINAEQRSHLTGRGGFPSILALKRDEQGLLKGSRHIRLEHV